MRALLLVLLLATPLAAADPAPTVRQCTSQGCVAAEDRDGDGAHDWANAALVVGEQVVVNANLDDRVLFVESHATTEELVDLDPLGRGFLTLSVHSLVDARRPEGPGAREAQAWVFLTEGDHETGATETLAWATARAILP